MASHTQLHMLESEDGRGSDHGIIRKTAIDGGVPQCLRADVRRARAHVVRAEDGTQAWKSSMPLMAPSSKEQLPLKVPYATGRSRVAVTVQTIVQTRDSVVSEV